MVGPAIDAPDWRSVVAEMTSALQAVERTEFWADGDSHRACALCRAWEDRPHRPDCLVGLALARVEELED